MKKKSRKKLREPQACLAKVKGGYLAVIDGGGETLITKKETVEEIKELLKTRRRAGERLSKIIHDTGITTASIHRVAVVLGEGD